MVFRVINQLIAKQPRTLPTSATAMNVNTPRCGGIISPAAPAVAAIWNTRTRASTVLIGCGESSFHLAHRTMSMYVTQAESHVCLVR
jgi:hypothetical protein